MKSCKTCKFTKTIYDLPVHTICSNKESPQFKHVIHSLSTGCDGWKTEECDKCGFPLVSSRCKTLCPNCGWRKEC
jgi:hypothetical protein